MAAVKKRSAIDEHWANWKKRHRSPRAIDVLIQTRKKEAAESAKSKEESTKSKEASTKSKTKETPIPGFDVTDIKKSF